MGYLTKIQGLGAALVTALALSSAANAMTSFDAAADFSLASNPNGVWSYLYSNTLLPSAQTSGNTEYWWSNQSVPNSIIVGRAITGTAASGTVQFGDSYLTMDPESQTVTVRFTAPSAGAYLISGMFFGADDQTNCGNSCAAHPVLITDSVDGTIFGPSSISSYLQSYAFNLNVTLAAGETVDFIAQTGTNGGCAYCNLSTGLQATISETPLPAALPLFASGLGAIGVLGWRRKRKAVV
jgi:hypothetical protein